MASLFICATPIGHLDDVSFRLLDTLKSVSFIAAEDTRVTQKLCQRYDITTPLFSLQKFNEKSRVSKILALLDEGNDIALVSDAGTPAISDPGSVLVSEISQSGKDHAIIPIPGPSSVTALLSASGLPADSFFFAGFLPRKEAELKRFLDRVSALQSPIVGFESPNRIEKTLERIRDYHPDTQVVLGKELSKKHETIIRGYVNDVIDQLRDMTVKGEFVLAFIFPDQVTDTDDSKAVIADLKQQGLSASQTCHIATHYCNIPKNHAYKLFHDLDQDT